MSFGQAFASVDQQAVKSLTNTSSQNDVEEIKNFIVKNDNEEFLLSFNGAEAQSEQNLSYAMYLNRNKTIGDIAGKLDEENTKMLNGKKDTYTRQSEINEWQAQNKLDTLFFLQMLFLFFSVFVVLLFLRQSGILPNSLLWFIMSVLSIVLIAILWNRASYTFFSRDKRYWNRRFIGLDDAGSGLQAKLQCNNS